jgi:hypothetical protein
MAVISLTPFGSVVVETPDGDVDISMLSNSPDSDDFMGLSQIAMKYNDYFGFPVVDITLIVGKHTLGSGVLDKIFSLNSNWTINMGWNPINGNVHDNSIRIHQMQYVKHTLTYDSLIRGYQINVQLMPTSSRVLTQIPMSLCQKSIALFRIAPDTLSLGFVIKTILDECLEVVGSIVKMRESVSTGEEQIESELFNVVAGAPQFKSLLVHAERESTRTYGSLIEDAVNAGNISLADKLYEDNGGNIERAVISETLSNADPDDIPRPSEIVVIHLARDPEESRLKHAAFSSFRMADSSMIDRVAMPVDHYSKYTVYQYLLDILEKNGYMIHVMPNMLTSRGGLQYRIFPNRVNARNSSFTEYEFNGVYSANATGPSPIVDIRGLQDRSLLGPVRGESKTISTHERDEKFTLIANTNIIKSVDANTETANSSYQSILAENRLNENNAGPTEEDEDSSNLNKSHLMSMFQLDAEKAKTISFEILGYPKIKIYDNFFVDFSDKVFTGLYKVLEMSHTMTDSGDFSSTIECVQILESDGIDGNVYKDEKVEEDPWIKTFKEDVIKGFTVEEGDSQGDLLRKFRR